MALPGFRHREEALPSIEAPKSDILHQPDVPAFPEIPVSPEQSAEYSQDASSVREADEPVVASMSVSLAPTAVVPVKDDFTQQIEDFLAEDLTDLYLKMTPSEQRIFKEKGEETASKIRQLLQSAKVNVGQILRLIRDWLKLIPGVNKFFLEQEAKIKTDKILDAAEKRRSQDPF
ncbi:hypothetical protein HY734_00285 [Candidatus Uhrbacteria bacterium]|nr:hypothetical protein [Candidatus Uhrbacteria bacterium]